ncbi:hypothetical protein LJR219_002900 [Phenylobacterium sp. LjRoot219]|uniref:hypothetical protein n=1 Tax=Phenylobacterium sp. LjRoot219 TaxID=3342283 RepID=UPI003ECC4D3D
MTKEQFQALAEAYGGEIARWPAAMRDEAALFAASEPAQAQAVLAREAALDAALDAAPRPAPAPSALYDRILADAPGLPRRLRWRLWLTPAGLGAALAGAAAAGVVLGAQLGDRSTTGAEASAQAVADLDVSTVAEVG